MNQPKQKWFFLRGLVRESGHWAGFLEAFSRRFPEREVIALDLPGNGRRYREPSPLNITATVEAMRPEYLTRRGDENFLFAISLGAMAGVEWMNLHPGDWSGAVLVNTSLRGLSPLHHRLRPANYLTILRLMGSADLRERERTILRMTSRSPEKFDQLEKDWTQIQSERPVSVKNAVRQLLAAVRFRPPHAKPAAKILLLNSAHDELVSPACSAALAQHWGSCLLTNAKAGHDLTLDDPEWVLEKLRDPFI